MRKLSDEEAEGHVQNIRATGFSVMEDAIYGPADPEDPYLERRNALHAERLAAREGRARR